MYRVPLDDQLPSQPQKEWEVIADTLRGHVDRLAKIDLKPDEVKFVIDAAHAAFQFDLVVRSFDSRVDTITDGNCEH